MYIKLVSDGSTASYIERNGMADIEDALLGATSVGSPFITSSSVLNQGTSWSNGIYYNFVDGGGSTSGTLSFKKYHYAKNGSYTPSAQINIVHSSYGILITIATQNNSNNIHNITSRWNSKTNNTPAIHGSHYNDVEAIHIIANDTTFAIQVQSTGTDSSRRHGTFILNDLEYIPEIDDYAYAANNQYFPFVAYWHSLTGNTRVPGSAASTYRNWCTIGRPQYIDRFGTFRNTSINFDSNYHYGYQDTINQTYATIEPRPRNEIHSIPGAGGENINQLVPVYYMGHMDDSSKFGDPRRGRLLNWYRTSDNLGQTGTVLTQGDTRYRLFGDVGKAGDESYQVATENICYAFPEDNIPYVS